MIGLDTNLLLRTFVIDDDEQVRRASAFMVENCSAASPGFINRIVLCEFVWTLDRAYNYPRATIVSAIEKLLMNEALIVEDQNHIRALLPDYAAGNAGFVDLLIGRINRAHGCDTTATFDRKAAKLDGFVLVR